MWRRLGGHPKAVVDQDLQPWDSSLSEGEPIRRVEREREREGEEGFGSALQPLEKDSRGCWPNRWPNFFAPRFNEAFLNSPRCRSIGRGSGRGQGDPASATIRRSSFGQPAVRALDEETAPLAGSFSRPIFRKLPDQLQRHKCPTTITISNCRFCTAIRRDKVNGKDRANSGYRLFRQQSRVNAGTFAADRIIAFRLTRRFLALA